MHFASNSRKLIVSSFGFLLIASFLITPLAGLIPFVGGAPEDWWNTSWTYRKPITIDHTKVAASLLNFPVLIDITDSDLASKAQDDGGDIVFVNSDNTVKLDHQVELFESSTGHLVAWVKVPTLSPTADTGLYMYYGNAGVSNQENPVGVWDSNFGMVLHLSDTSGQCVDSTANDNDGTVSGPTQGVIGKISRAYDFDGVNDYVEVPHDSMLGGFTAGFTVSTWFSVDTNTKRMTLLQKYNTAGNQRGWLVEYKNDVGPRSIALLASPNGVSLSWWYAAFTPTVGTWYHLTVVWQSNTAPRFYINGQLLTTITGGGAPIASIFNNVNAPLHIGRNTYSSAYYLDGRLDEVQLSNVARSTAWTSTLYNNQNSPSSFYAVGSEETQGASVLVISNESPSNGATGVYTNPTLSARVTGSDGSMTVVFSALIGGNWIDLKTFSGVGDGVYSWTPTEMGEIGTAYSWRVSADDGVAAPIEKTFSFTTTATILSSKWTRSGLPAGESGVLMADVNNDGLEEVIKAGAGRLYVLRGTDGSTLWWISDSSLSDMAKPQMADLDGDGILEIIVNIAHGIMAVHSNNGAIYWRRDDLSGGNHWSSPVVGDIDGSGHPTVFVASEDVTHGANGLGRLSSLSYDGQLLHQVFTWRPCFGGLSLADADNDGRFEVFMGDRNNNYGDGNYGRGVRCFYADDLTIKWERPEILSSSHCPVLEDINDDGLLEVMAGQNGAFHALDPRDGSDVRPYSFSAYNFPLHFQPSAYDLDLDGHPEMLMADGHDATSDDVSVWDLTDWKQDGRVYVGKCYYGPKAADVTGDGIMELIPSSYGSVHVFDRNLNPLTSVSLGGENYATRLTYAVVQDIDGDGYLELVVSSYNGSVWAFDTPARKPTLRIRSEVQHYNEQRTGAAEYVPLHGSFAPVIKDISPSNGEMDVPIELSTLSFTLVDFQGDLMSYTVTTTPNIGSGSGTDVGNGQYSVGIGGLEYGKTYSWTISVTDGSHVTTETCTFTTKALPPWWNINWQYRKTITIDPAQVSGDQTDFPVLVDITDSSLIGKVQLDGDDIVFVNPDSTKLSHEIESYDGATGHLVAWVRVPIVSSTTFTTFYMYYGNSAASNQEDPAAVWDTGYKLVLHLSETHECRMWGMVSDSLPHDVVLNHLITASSSLKVLGGSNVNGWGLVWYPGTTPEIRRGYPQANLDPNFDLAANEMADSGATVGVGHVRAAASGGIPSTGNPHPFMRFKNGKWWAFSHNGVLDKTTLRNLIGAEYLAANPPTFPVGGSWTDSDVIDTDLYHLYVMKCIEQSNWDVLTGIAKAVSDITGATSGAANFLLTDGTTLWGFRKGNTLSYYYQSTSPTYSVVASQPPDPTQTGWTSMIDYNLVILTRNNAPYLISDIRQFKLLADSTFDASADSAALIANGAGQDWYESRNDVPTLLYLDETNIAGNAGKKAGFTASSSGNAYLSQEFGAPQTGVFSVQWDIYVDSILAISGTDRAGWMMIGDDFNGASGPNQPSSERFVYLAFFKDGGATSGTMDLVAKNSTDNFALHAIIASGLNLKQWYTIKVIVDVGAKTYDVYVDGVLVAKVGSAFARTTVTHISFAQWNDGAGAFYVDNVVAPAPISSHTLSVDIVGSGTVTKNPDMPTYGYGSQVTITAAPSAGWAFSGWTGDYVGSTNPATITMDSNKEITATFIEDVYTLTVNVVGSGSVAKTPDLPTYNYGDEVTLTANPNAGYKFVVWGGDLSGTANPAVITMTGNKVVTATFLLVDTQVCVDSSVYGDIGTLYGDVTQGAVGKIDGAYAFDGVNDYVRFAHRSTLTGYTNSFTASFWLRLDDVSKRQTILNKYNSAGNQRGWYIEFQTSATLGKVFAFFASADGTNYRDWYARFTPTSGTWYYITLVWEANTVPRFYVNGVQLTTVGTGTIASIYNNAGAPLDIGRSTYTSDRFLRGSLDEIRISNPARSVGYMLTCYNNQKDPSLFYQVGQEESLPETPIISDPNPANLATDVPTSLTELSFNLADYQNDLMDYTVTTTPDIGTGSGTGVSAGTHSISIAGLQYGTTYTWEVSVTDGTHSTTATYTFTTIPQFLVDSELANSADSADLRTNSPEQDWYESRAQVPTLLFLDETDIGGNTGKKAGFTASASGNAYLTQEFSSPQTGVFSVQYDIYVDSILDISGSPDRSGIMMLGGTSASYGPNRNDVVRFVFLAFYKNGGATGGTADLVAMTTFSAFTTVAADLNLDQWYTIRVVVDYAAKTYEVFVDGVSKGSYAAVSTWAQSAVTHISFAQWNDGAGAFYVDNVFSPAEDRYTLATTVIGSGSISRSLGESTYGAGSEVTLTAVPAAGWSFSGWSGDVSGTDNPTTITMDGDKTVTATFETEISWTIAASAGVGGTIDPSGDVVVADGADQTFTITAETGHAIADVLVDGVSVGPVPTYTFFAVSKDCTIAASFKLVPLIVDSEFLGSVDSADLRIDSVGQDWYESRNSVPTLLYLDETDVGGNLGKKAGFTASSSGNAYLTQGFASAQTGTFSVQWDIYVDSILDISSPDRAGWMLIGDDSTSGNGPNAANGERFVYMAFFKNGGGTSGAMDLIAVDRDDSFSVFTTVASGLNIKQWYTIKVVCDLNADTYDVYVDGVFQATMTSRIAKTSVTHISFAQWNDGAGAFFVDNVYSPAL